MADAKISALAAITSLGDTDELAVASGGASKKITGANMKASIGPQKLYDFTVTGSDKASIDTDVDGSAALLATTFTVLEIWLVARTDEAVIQSVVDLTFNNDGTAIYDTGYMTTNTTANAVSTGLVTAGSSAQMLMPGASAAANVAGVFRATIPAYADTTFYKIMEWLNHLADTSAGTTHRALDVETTLYRSTSAITRVKVAPDTSGKKLKVGSRLLIFGR